MLQEKLLRIDVNEKPSTWHEWLVLSFQHVFAMFGATVLVPLLTGMDVGVALVSSGVGTLIYILVTKGKVPIYLGSSFAYIGAVTTAAAAGGLDSAYIGIIGVGIVYAIVATVIRFTGNGWIKKLLAPVVVGPMIIIIGLSLAGVAVNSAGLNGASGWKVPLVAIITFATVVVIALLGKGFFKIIPFIAAVLVGYVFSMIFGLVPVDFFLGFIPYPDVFSTASFLQLPQFTFFGTYDLDMTALLTFLPLSFVTIAEHIGDHTVLGEITGRDYISDPGLENTLMGDGLATLAAGLIGGPANTSYGENTGVVAITKVGSVWVTGGAACLAIFLGFFGWVQAFVNSIPWAVIGGMTIILYGLISANGVRVLVKNKVDIGNMRNLIIIATMLVIGLGGASLPIGPATLTGMSLAAIVGILLNLVLPQDQETSN